MTRLLKSSSVTFVAVEQVDVVAGALSADVWQRPGLLQRLAARAARRNHDRVAELREREEVAAVQRELHDLAVLDDVADLGGVSSAAGAIRPDGDGFREPLERRASGRRSKVRPISRTTVSGRPGAKAPSSVAASSQRPIRSAGSRNRPSRSATRVAAVPLSGRVAVTTASGTGAPVRSRTTPTISPVLICAAAAVVGRQAAAATIPRRKPSRRNDTPPRIPRPGRAAASG